MLWDVKRGSRKMCTFEVYGTGSAEDLLDNTTVLDAVINKATVLPLAEDVCSAVRDEGCDNIEFILCFRKYGLMQLKMVFEEFNWTMEDWAVFRYHMALALVAVVRKYRMGCYRKGSAFETAWRALEEMEQGVLDASGDPDAYRQTYEAVKSQSLRVAETGSR